MRRNRATDPPRLRGQDVERDDHQDDHQPGESLSPQGA